MIWASCIDPLIGHCCPELQAAKVALEAAEPNTYRTELCTEIRYSAFLGVASEGARRPVRRPRRTLDVPDVHGSGELSSCATPRRNPLAAIHTRSLVLPDARCRSVVVSPFFVAFLWGGPLSCLRNWLAMCRPSTRVTVEAKRRLAAAKASVFGEDEPAAVMTQVWVIADRSVQTMGSARQVTS